MKYYKFKILLIIIAINVLTYGCSIYHNGYYHGYVYDYSTRAPLSNVLVIEHSKEIGKSTLTDSNGFFKLNNGGLATDLIFKLKGYKIDTIPTEWQQHGEQLQHTFINEKPDTIYLLRIK